MECMDTDPLIQRLTKAADDRASTKAADDAARSTLVQAIRDAASAGVPQVEIAKATGYTRERIRQLTR